MLRKGFIPAVLAAVLLSVSAAAHSQVVHAATEDHEVLTVGGGLSSYILDYGHTRKMEGVTVWVDWKLPHMPSLLDGLGIEAEGRDINFGRPSTLPRMRQDTALIGAYYKWHKIGNFRPYAKYLAGIGSIDFPAFPGNPAYDHDTRTVLAPGGGVDYQIGRHFAVRLDYEYQFWRAIFGPRDLNPNGLTLGAVYSFGGRR